MSYAERVDGDRRLVILRLLVEDEGSANESVLEHGLLALGHRVGLDREAVRQHLRFLRDADCLTIDMFRDKVMVASITGRGVAVAEGRVRIDGVSKPAIGS